MCKSFLESSSIMRILSLRVENFKSFSSPATTVSLDPHVNVIVGRNGSGKSNLFSAISLVLQGAAIPDREKLHLIHESGAKGAARARQAVVEIVLDNKDRRMPVTKDEVVIRYSVVYIGDEKLRFSFFLGLGRVLDSVGN